MTPRKELFLKIQEAVASIPEIEYVDLHRKQFDNGKEHYPTQYTCVLIKVGDIDYETMVEHTKQGRAEIEVLLYCQDGWLDQHQDTTDPNNGLIEIDLIDAVTEKLEFLFGDFFKPLELVTEGENEVSDNSLMSYRMIFGTRIYKKVNYKVVTKKLKLN